MSQDRDLLGQGILYIFRLLFVTIFLLSLIQKRICVCVCMNYMTVLCAEPVYSLSFTLLINFTEEVFLSYTCLLSSMICFECSWDIYIYDCFFCCCSVKIDWDEGENFDEYDYFDSPKVRFYCTWDQNCDCCCCFILLFLLELIPNVYLLSLSLNT